MGAQDCLCRPQAAPSPPPAPSRLPAATGSKATAGTETAGVPAATGTKTSPGAKTTRHRPSTWWQATGRAPSQTDTAANATTGSATLDRCFNLLKIGCRLISLQNQSAPKILGALCYSLFLRWFPSWKPLADHPNAAIRILSTFSSMGLPLNGPADQRLA